MMRGLAMMTAKKQRSFVACSVGPVNCFSVLCLLACDHLRNPVDDALVGYDETQEAPRFGGT